MWLAIKLGAWLGERAVRPGGLLHHMWDADAASKAAATGSRRKEAQRKRAKETPKPPLRRQPVTPRGGVGGDDRPATAKQIAYLRKLAADACQPTPQTAGMTAATASAWIEHLGGRRLEQRAEARRARIEPDRAAAVAARHTRGLTGHAAGGGAQAIADHIRDLRQDYAQAQAHGDHDRMTILEGELVHAEARRMRARESLYEDRYLIERRLEETREGSQEWAEAIDDLAAIDDRLAILTVNAGH